MIDSAGNKEWSESLKTAIRESFFIAQKNDREKISPEDFLVISIKNDDLFQNIAEKHKFSCSHAIDRTMNSVPTSFEKYKINNKTKINTEEIKKMYGRKASISPHLNSAINAAKAEFRTNELHPLTLSHVLYVLLRVGIVDTRNVLNGRNEIIDDMRMQLLPNDEVSFYNSYPNKSEINRKKNDSFNNASKEKIIRSISNHLQSNKECIEALSIAMARLAQHELDILVQERPNSPEAIADNDEKIELMSIFIRGFSRIADDIGNMNNSNHDSKSIEDASKSVISLSEALEKWWNNKHQRIIDTAVGMPVMLGTFAALKYCGADSITQGLVVGTTAAALLGENSLSSALKMAKLMKSSKSPEND